MARRSASLGVLFLPLALFVASLPLVGSQLLGGVPSVLSLRNVDLSERFVSHLLLDECNNVLYAFTSGPPAYAVLVSIPSLLRVGSTYVGDADVVHAAWHGHGVAYIAGEAAAPARGVPGGRILALARPSLAVLSYVDLANLTPILGVADEKFDLVCKYYIVSVAASCVPFVCFVNSPDGTILGARTFCEVCVPAGCGGRAIVLRKTAR